MSWNDLQKLSGRSHQRSVTDAENITSLIYGEDKSLVRMNRKFPGSKVECIPSPVLNRGRNLSPTAFSKPTDPNVVIPPEYEIKKQADVQVVTSNNSKPQNFHLEQGYDSEEKTTYSTIPAMKSEYKDASKRSFWKKAFSKIKYDGLLEKKNESDESKKSDDENDEVDPVYELLKSAATKQKALMYNNIQKKPVENSHPKTGV